MPYRRSEVGSADLQDLIDTMTKVNSLLSTPHAEEDDDAAPETPVDLLRPPSVFCGDAQNFDSDVHDMAGNLRPPSLFRSSVIDSSRNGHAAPLSSFPEGEEIVQGHSDSSTGTAATANENVQLWLSSLAELFPARLSAELRDIAASSASLDHAIQTVISTQRIVAANDGQDHGNVEESHAGAWRPTPKPRPRPRSQGSTSSETDLITPITLMNASSSSHHAWNPEIHEQEALRNGTEIATINSTDTDAGFLDCPPPPDFVLEVNKVMFDSGRAGADENTNSSIYSAIKPPPASSHESISPSTSVLLDTAHATSAVVRESAHPANVITPTNHSAEFSGFDGLDTVDLTLPTATPVRQQRPPTKEHSIPATDEELRRTVEDLVESRLLRQNRASSEYASGSDTESITSGMSSEAISQIVAQTVERLLKDRGGTTTSLDTLSPRSSLASQSPRNSGIDDGLCSGDRGVRGATSVGGSHRGDSGYGNDHSSYRNSTESTMSQTLRGDNRRPHMPEPSVGSYTPLGGRDMQYIAGNDTMDQLALPSGDKHLKASTKARARDRIRRLVSGRGAPVTGQCIYVQHEPSLGFGFSISGAAPVFVHSIVTGGPCDHGIDGLLPGDVILKIGNVPCATSSRDAVVQLIEAIPPGEYLVTVVARTPLLQRKVYPEGRGSQSAPTSPIKPRGLNSTHTHHHDLEGSTMSPLRRTGSLNDGRTVGGRVQERRGSEGWGDGSAMAPRPPRMGSPRSQSPHEGPISSAPNIPFSGWLSLLVASNSTMVWERYWVAIGEGVLAYYDGLDGRNSTPLKPTGTIPLEGACCSACGHVDRITRHFAFKIVYKSSAPVYLSAASETSLWEWIRNITVAANDSSSYGFDC